MLVVAVVDLLDSRNAVCPLTFVVFLQFKLDLVSLKKRVAKPRVFHAALVEENLFARCRNDESKSLCRIIKLHYPSRHTPVTFRCTADVYKKKKPRSRP